MKKSLVSIFLMITLLVTMLLGCERNKSITTQTEPVKEDTQKVIHLRLNEVAHSIFYAPMYVAIENHYFEDEGIELELITGYGADKTMTAVLSGDADIGFMGAESAIYAYQEGATDVIKIFAQLTQRAGNFLVSREKNDDFTWDDLKGSTVLGGRKGGMPEMVFEYILKQNNIATTDLTIDQSIDFGSTAAAFSGGQGEYTIEFEPSATKLEQEGDGYVVASLGVASGYVPYTSYCAKNSYIQSNPDAIQKFTNALQKGMNYCQEHSSSEIAKVILPQFKDSDLPTLTTIVSRYHEQDTWKNDLVFEEASFLLLQDILKDAGELKENIPYKNVVLTEYANAAKE